MPESLLDVLARYVEASPRRAWGGLYALSGFDYQLRSYLAAFADALAAASNIEAAGTDFEMPLLEVFSDTVQVSDERTVFVQLKRRLTMASMKAAAEEFVAIDTFLESEAPALRDGARYQVVAQAGDGQLTWDSVSLPGNPTIECCNRFTALRDEGRLAPPRLEPDPWWHLLATVYPVLDDPMDFAREALELCLRRRDIGPVAVRDGIFNGFARRRRDRNSTVKFLRPTDFETQADLTRDVLVGHTPSLDLLRRGHYMDRTHHVTAARAGLNKLLDQRAGNLYRSLDVFWIDGRSGKGKSALLLQIMRDLVVDGALVAWLDISRDNLIELLAHYPQWQGTRPLPEYIFVDDLYDPQNQLILNTFTLASMIDRSPYVDWPVLVTCGTPEFHVALTRDVGDTGVQVHPWRLPHVDRSESQALRAWFEERTGAPPKSGDAFDHDDGLIISMSYEMKYGSISQDDHLTAFGRRFRQRLEAAGLIDALRKPLALNRLYIWAPTQWLTEDQFEKLDELNDDSDFSFLEAERRTGDWTGDYLKVTHPHLSDAIYRAIRKPATPRSFGNDLVNSFDLALKTDSRTARRILRVLADGHSRLALLDMKAVASGCARIWTENGEAVAGFDLLTIADAWTSWAVWAARDPQVAVDPDSLTRARKALPTDPPVWAALWERLWRAYPGDVGLAADAASWLSEPQTWGLRDWSFIWEKVTLSPSNEAERPSLLRNGVAWAKRNDDRPDWSFVWQRLVNLYYLLPEDKDGDALLRIGAGRLVGRENRPEWASVWDGMTKSHDVLPTDIDIDELLRAGAAWLVGREDQTGWVFVWQGLIELHNLLPPDLDIVQLLRDGNAWLGGREGHVGWAFVLQGLIKCDVLPSDIDIGQLLRAGVAWLQQRDDQAEWAFVWQSLFSRDVLPPDIDTHKLLHDGNDWLDGREDRPEWTHVWRHLLDASVRPLSDIDTHLLLRDGIAWLDRREDRPEWPFVWERLTSCDVLPSNIKDQLLRIGTARLVGRQDGPEWPRIWEHLVELRKALPADISMDQLLRDGNAWLRGRENWPGWNYVWQLLLKNRKVLPAEVDADTLLLNGNAWLRGRENRSEWNYVWQQLVKLRKVLPADIDKDQLLRNGADWLCGHENRPGWNYVWQLLLKNRKVLPAEVDADTLLRNGNAWLRGRENCREWTHVWRYLLNYDKLPDEIDRYQILDKGIVWLHGRENHREWSIVWEHLLDIHDALLTDVKDQLLRDGAAWLPDRENCREWTHVWRYLLKFYDNLPEEIDRNQLLRVATAWLKGREDLPQWTRLWERLVELRDLMPEDINKVQLLRDGAAWLRGKQNRSDWIYVWERLVELREVLPKDLDKDQLLRDGAAWLRVHKKSSKWRRIWRQLDALREILPEDINLDELNGLPPAAS